MPKQPSSSDTALRIILMIAAVIAIGSIGFFLAVLLQKSSAAPSTASAPALMVAQQKQAAMQSLAASEDMSSSTATSTGTTASSTAAQSATPSASQADQNDPNAAAKLKILEGLNSQ